MKKKILFILSLFFLQLISAFAEEQQGTFVIQNNDFKDIYNKYRVSVAKNVPWAGSYWAFARNGTTYNGMYSNTNQLGPDQKFDQIFNTRGAATSWEMQNNSCEHLSDPKTKEQCMGWWGHCNAWSGAAVKEIEPRVSAFFKSPGNRDVLLTVADQKALYTELYMSTGDFFVGDRINEKVGDWIWDKNSPIARKKIYPNYADSPTNYDAFWDVTPRAFFLTFTNYIGIQGVGLVIDRFTGDQVWNQPVAAYKIYPLTSADIMAPETQGNVSVYPVLVKMRMYWANDGVPEGVLSEKFDFDRIEKNRSNHYASRLLKFYLYFDAPVELSSDGTVSSAGKIVGNGTWYHQTRQGRAEYGDDMDATHPDFIWMPTAPMDSNNQSSKPPAMTAPRVQQIMNSKVELVDYYKNSTRSEFQTLSKQIAALEVDSDERLVHLNILRKNALSSWAKVVDDYAVILAQPADLENSYPADDYFTATSEMLHSLISSLSAATPVETISEFEKFLLKFKLGELNFDSDVMKLETALVGKWQDMDSFTNRMSLMAKKFSPESQDDLLALMSTQMNAFFAFNPTLAQVMALQSAMLMTETMKDREALGKALLDLKERATPLAKTDNEFTSLMKPEMKKPTPDFLMKLKVMALKNPFRDYANAKVTNFADWLDNHQKLCETSQALDVILKHKLMGLGLITRGDELHDLLSVSDSSVKDLPDFKKQMAGFVLYNLTALLVNSKATYAQSKELNAVVADFDFEKSVQTKKAALSLVASFADLLDAGTDFSGSTLSDSYFAVFMPAFSEALNRLKLTDASAEELQSLYNLSFPVASGKHQLSEEVRKAIYKILMGASNGVAGIKSVLKSKSADDRAKYIENTLAQTLSALDSAPSVSDLLVLEDVVPDSAAVEFRKVAMTYVKSYHDYLLLSSTTISSPSKTLLKGLLEFREAVPFTGTRDASDESSLQSCTYGPEGIIYRKLRFEEKDIDKDIACKMAEMTCLESAHGRNCKLIP